MPTYTINLTQWTNNTGTGSVQWFNASNAEYVDGSFAKTNAITGTTATYYLIGTWPSSISPAGNEIISSLTATVTRACGGGSVTDNKLRLVVGGVVTTLDKASVATWPGSLGAATYAWSSSDLASLGVTLATVQLYTFGVALSAALNNVSGNGAIVDAIVLTVNTTYVYEGSGNNVLPPYGVR